MDLKRAGNGHVPCTLDFFIINMILEDDLRGAGLLLEHFNIKQQSPDISLLEKLLDRFSSIPYENATKIIKAGGDVYNNFRFPPELAGDYIKFGSGGTCFSLVYLFKSLMDECGFTSKLVLADRNYGSDTHTAVLVSMGDELFLADPGYLIFTPIKLSREKPVLHHTGLYDISIDPLSGGKFFDVYSLFPDGNRKFRYRIKNEFVHRDVYLEAWKKSFEFEMMNSLVITKVSQREHFYIRNNFFQHNSLKGKIKKHITTEELIRFTSGAGISAEVIRKALTILGRI